jgi:pseudaminic acid synthase
VNIGALKVGAGEPCAIIAEIGNAHGGSFERAIRLLDAAKACAASAAKLQAYTPQELVGLRGDGPAPEPWGSQGWTMLSLYQKARTPLRWLPSLYDYAATIGLPLFSSVFGPESLAMLEDCGNPAYKIARLDSAHEDLVSAVVRTGKPYLVSTDRRRVDYVDTSGRRRGVRGDNLLYCTAGYPTPAEAMKLPQFEDPDGYVYYIGLSSHCLDPRLPVAAVARGAKMIEMHFMLDDEPSELEANVSLGESAFAEMVRNVRATEALLA